MAIASGMPSASATARCSRVTHDTPGAVGRQVGAGLRRVGGAAVRRFWQSCSTVPQQQRLPCYSIMQEQQRLPRHSPATALMQSRAASGSSVVRPCSIVLLYRSWPPARQGGRPGEMGERQIATLPPTGIPLAPSTAHAQLCVWLGGRVSTWHCAVNAHSAVQAAPRLTKVEESDHSGGGACQISGRQPRVVEHRSCGGGWQGGTEGCARIR